MTRVIINADDFGMSSKVNEEIKSLISKGLITSTTILANGEAAVDAFEFARSCSQVSFGVHLNLTEFEPLLNSTKHSKFCNEKSVFNGQFESLVNLSDFNLIVFEWGKQIERIVEEGINISHIDSHHHIHTRPEVFFALKKIMKKYNIRNVRTTRNLITKSEYSSTSDRFKLLKKNIWDYGLRNYCPKSRSTDYFGSVNDLIRFCNQNQFYLNSDKLKDFFKGKCIEIMCHPGSEYSEYIEECNQLTNGLRSLIGIDYSLISYNQL